MDNILLNAKYSADVQCSKYWKFHRSFILNLFLKKNKCPIYIYILIFYVTFKDLTSHLMNNHYNFFSVPKRFV